MDIYLVRHGESTGNAVGVLMGWSEHPLTDRGRAQAAAVAARLALLGPMPVICSDLPRARETAQIIAARWGGEIIPDTRWRECHCGECTGLSWEQIADAEALRARFDADPWHTALPGGGESLAMLRDRVAPAFAELCARSDDRLTLVTHDGVIRALLAYCLDLPPTRYWTLATDNAGLTHLRVTGEWISIRTVNDISHLMVVPGSAGVPPAP